MEGKIYISMFLRSLTKVLCSPETATVFGGMQYFYERTCFVKEYKVSWGNAILLRENKCFVRKCKVSWRNAIFLRENAVSRRNAVLLRENTTFWGKGILL